MLDDIESYPDVVVLDLDDTLWAGDVDCTGGPPFKPHKNSRHTISCRRGRPVTLFHDVPDIFDELTDREIGIAYASRTWEPEWAKDALGQFPCGKRRIVNMWNVAAGHSWGDLSKTSHLSDISRQLALPISSMVFIDNEMRNIRDVSPMGASCGYCPNGLNWQILRETLVQHSDTIRRKS